jgi:hypothetical protein
MSRGGRVAHASCAWPGGRARAGRARTRTPAKPAAVRVPGLRRVCEASAAGALVVRRESRFARGTMRVQAEDVRLFQADPMTVGCSTISVRGMVTRSSR